MTTIRQTKEIKYANWKRRGKTVLYAGDMIPYHTNPKDATKKKKLLRLINEFNKVVGHKIDIQK